MRWVESRQKHNIGDRTNATYTKAEIILRWNATAMQYVREEFIGQYGINTRRHAGSTIKSTINYLTTITKSDSQVNITFFSE